MKVGLRRVIAAWLAVTACLGLASWLYQALASASETVIFPPPGQLVEVGGYRLHLYCTGPRHAEKPTVLLEAGLGAPGLVWTLTQREVEKHYRVCSYDRAGYGWSDPGPAPRAAQQFVAELHFLLEAAGEAPPFLLVGHSLGSLIARVYTAAYPQDVAGLLFLDPRHEDFFSRMPPESLVIDERNFEYARRLVWMTPLGYTRLLGMTGQLNDFEAYLAPLPADVEAAAWARMIYRPGHWKTSVAERESSAATYALAKAAHLPTNLPLLVLTAGDGWRAWSTGDESHDEVGRAIWLRLQEEQSHLTARGGWQVLPGVGHYLYYEQPAAIVEALAWLAR